MWKRWWNLLIINEKEYTNTFDKVSFGKYSVTQDGKKRVGLSPFITFKSDNIILGLETVYDKEWLEELKIKDKKDISKYITDITYEDEKGWICLITGNYKCFITRLEDNIFIIELNSETEECGQYYNIVLNEKVKFIFEAID